VRARANATVCWALVTELPSPPSPAPAALHLQRGVKQLAVHFSHNGRRLLHAREHQPRLDLGLGLRYGAQRSSMGVKSSRRTSSEQARVAYAFRVAGWSAAGLGMAAGLSAEGVNPARPALRPAVSRSRSTSPRARPPAPAAPQGRQGPRRGCRRPGDEDEDEIFARLATAHTHTRGCVCGASRCVARTASWRCRLLQRGDGVLVAGLGRLAVVLLEGECGHVPSQDTPAAYKLTPPASSDSRVHKDAQRTGAGGAGSGGGGQRRGRRTICRARAAPPASLQ
jgi:hypothetical protein